jgi:hypothetical protein
MIKSQQDIKNENRIKNERFPKTMEQKNEIEPEPVQTTPNLMERVTTIEAYLSKVDQAFEKIITEIENLKNLVKITQNMDIEISKLTGDIVRLTKLEENRYIELANAINHTTEKVTTMDEYIPIFIDKRIKDYFDELAVETEGLEEPAGDTPEPQP